MRKTVEQINALEPDFEKLSDEGLIEKTAELIGKLKPELGDWVPQIIAEFAAPSPSLLYARDAFLIS